MSDDAFGVICIHLDTCIKFPYMCGNCKNNKGKKDFYEPAVSEKKREWWIKSWIQRDKWGKN